MADAPGPALCGKPCEATALYAGGPCVREAGHLGRCIPRSVEDAVNRPGPAGTPCPVCGTALTRFTEEPGYTGPPRYWCPNLECDYMALPRPGRGPADPPTWQQYWEDRAMKELRHPLATEAEQARYERMTERFAEPAAPADSAPQHTQFCRCGHSRAVHRQDICLGGITGCACTAFVPESAVPREPAPFIPSRGEIGVPPEWVRFRLRAVVDKDTCPSCRDASGTMMYQCRAGETPPPFEHCEHVRAGGERKCRCVWEPAEDEEIRRHLRGVVADIGAFEIPRTAPAAEATPPWRWMNGPLGFLLRDATGAVMIEVTTSIPHAERPPNMAWLAFASPRVRTLTEAAPEMEAVLRRLVNCGRDPFGSPCVTSMGDEPPCGRCDGCIGAALLARMDAASKR